MTMTVLDQAPVTGDGDRCGVLMISPLLRFLSEWLVAMPRKASRVSNQPPDDCSLVATHVLPSGETVMVALMLSNSTLPVFDEIVVEQMN